MATQGAGRPAGVLGAEAGVAVEAGGGQSVAIRTGK